MKPNSTLRSYIESTIFPRYDHNDPGHGLSHIKAVIDRSFELANFHNLHRLNPDIIYAAASYHDIGCPIDRDHHEAISADIFLADDFMNKYFTKSQRTTISHAITDHRASLGHTPRNTYGKLLSSADRTIDLDDVLRRSYKWRLDLSDPDKIAESAYKHLVKKFGKESGYATKAIYFSDGKYEQYLADLQQLIADKSAYIARLKKANGLV